MSKQTDYEKIRSLQQEIDKTMPMDGKTIKVMEAALALSPEDRDTLLHKLQQAQQEIKPADGREIFCGLFEQFYGTSYYWTAKDYVALKQLLNKIKNKYTERRKDYDNEVILAGFKHYLHAVYNLKNDWYNSNFSMTILNSKFNELYVAISGKKQGKISNDYKQRILDDLQS